MQSIASVSCLLFGLIAVSLGSEQRVDTKRLIDRQNVTAASGLIASPEEGWPQWRGRWRDGISDEKGLLTKWPDGGPRLLWKATGLGKGWSSPVIVDGNLYLTGDVDDDLIVFAMTTEAKLR